jgi:hypothetical protein
VEAMHFPLFVTGFATIFDSRVSDWPNLRITGCRGGFECKLSALFGRNGRVFVRIAVGSPKNRVGGSGSRHCFLKNSE